ncbi:LemA family protein [bacterium]|nr:LemA family protein [bacterium]
MQTFYIILLAAVFVFVLWLTGTYNGLVKRKNRAREAWADIEVQLKRRYNLIPNLVEVVKGYATHEREVFQKVTEARTRAMGTKDTKEKAKAENMLTETLKSLFAVAENYPDLKASQNFLELQRELRDTEDKIQAARRFYNTNVRDLNIKIESVPSNVIAKMFGFKKMELFELEESVARTAPKVSF